MQKIEKKCDICGIRHEKETNVIGEYDTGVELISQSIKGVGKAIQGLKMDLCAKHHLEFLEKTRAWVQQTTSLDQYLAPAISQT